MEHFKVIFFVIWLINVNTQAVAMESIGDLSCFKIIDPKFLDELAEYAPENPDKCGYVQMFHIMAWDHVYQTEEKRPRLAPLLEEDYLHPAPEKFAYEINRRIFLFKAHVDGRNELNEEDLLTVVANNIDINQPLMAYFTGKKNILVTTIVGYKKDAPSQLLVLNSVGQGMERFSLIETEAFLMSMNFSPIFQEIQETDLNSIQKRFLAPFLENAEVWQPFTFIVFEKIKEEERRLNREKPKFILRRSYWLPWPCVIQ